MAVELRQCAIRRYALNYSVSIVQQPGKVLIALNPPQAKHNLKAVEVIASLPTPNPHTRPIVSLTGTSPIVSRSGHLTMGVSSRAGERIDKERSMLRRFKSTLVDDRVRCGLSS